MATREAAGLSVLARSPLLIALLCFALIFLVALSLPWAGPFALAAALGLAAGDTLAVRFVRGDRSWRKVGGERRFATRAVGLAAFLIYGLIAVPVAGIFVGFLSGPLSLALEALPCSWFLSPAIYSASSVAVVTVDFLARY